MMLHRKSLQIWKSILVIFLSLTLISCTTTLTETRVVDNIVIKQPRPSPLNLYEVQFYVVSPKNKEEFKQRFLKNNDLEVYIAFSVRDYENLAKNVSELERYIKQQEILIQYYEKALTKK